MKYIKLIALLLFTLNVYSQIELRFNKIIQDTAPQITNSVIALDTGYVFLSGTLIFH